MNIRERLLKIDLPPGKSAFLWGPRKVGKSYWIRHHCQNAIVIDMLKSEVFADYASHPQLLRERFQNASQLVVIDEVQMVPDLLNEVHWLIENQGISFLLTGSSARKLRRKHANLLGGRAWRYNMTPLCYQEIEQFDIEKIMTTGLLPAHLISPDPIQDIRSYVADYLKEEIAAEAVVQNIPAFAEFLRIAALTCGELLNYVNVARETGVSAKVVRNYFQILEDTMLGFRLQPWRRAHTRRLLETEKFYLFDIGVTNYLTQRIPTINTPEFGKAFEHFILMELMAYKAYRNPELPLYYWRTVSGHEIDFILGDMQVALEIKSSKRVHEGDVKNIKILQQEQKASRHIIISFEEMPKKLGNIECLPWEMFLQMLWNNDII
jgi:predicted AAA+ superfamily ATPase